MERAHAMAVQTTMSATMMPIVMSLRRVGLYWFPPPSSIGLAREFRRHRRTTVGEHVRRVRIEQA
jgi:hypothetical protein